MANTYGTKGAPAVGGGLPGLPEKTPVGTIKAFTAPPSPNWLLCDGTYVSKVNYPVLAQVFPGSVVTFLTERAAYPGDFSSGITQFNTSLDGQTVCISPNGISTLYYSTNGGVSFSTSALSSFAKCKHVGSNVVVFAENPTPKYFLSGGSWSLVSGYPASGWPIPLSTGGVVPDFNGNVLYFGTNNTDTRVYGSTDFGKSVTLKATITAFNTYSGAFNGQDTWYAGSEASTVRKSTDFGATWSAVGSTGLTGSISSMAASGPIVVAASQVNPKVVISYNYGATWSTLFTSVSPRSDGITTDWKGAWTISADANSKYTSNNWTTSKTLTFDFASMSNKYVAISNAGIHIAAADLTTNSWISPYDSDTNIKLPDIQAPSAFFKYYIKAK